jgi:hypothetical protein
LLVVLLVCALLGLMTDPQWPESVNLRGVNVALISTIPAGAGPGELFLKQAWQKWDIFCRQDAGVGVDDHSKKLEAVFERNQDVWNSKLAAAVEDSLQQPIGPRWCVPRPKAWGGPFAYGCIFVTTSSIPASSPTKSRLKVTHLHIALVIPNLHVPTTHQCQRLTIC